MEPLAGERGIELTVSTIPMFVRGDQARKGLGTRILVACEDAARAEGFRMLALMATLPGLLLYEHYGFRLLERTEVSLPDGVKLACAAMEKPIAEPAPSGRDGP